MNELDRLATVAKMSDLGIAPQGMAPQSMPMAPQSMPMAPQGPGMKKGGAVKAKSSSASKRADGCCVKGKTKGRMV